MQASGDKTKAVKQTPLIWCVEKALEKNGFPLVISHATNLEAADVMADRVSLVSQKIPVDLDVSADSLASLIDAESEAKEKQDDKPLRWAATIQKRDQTLIFGYFAGRPTIDMLVDLYTNILTGKAHSVGGYSVDGKNITINMPK